MVEHDFSSATFTAENMPAWRKCADCGLETLQARCAECSAKREEKERRTDAERVALESIHEGFRWATLADPLLAKRVRSRVPPKVIAQYIREHRMAFITGPSGCGKTSLAAACMRERLDGAFFVDACDLAEASQLQRLGRGEADLVGRARAAKLLVIDELVDPANAKARLELRRVIIHRHGRVKPTIITTGLDHSQLEKIFDDGVARRLFSRSSGSLVVRLGATEAPPAPAPTEPAGAS